MRNETLLTAFNGFRGNLKGHELASRLGNVDTKHQTDTCVFSSDVRLAVPQFDVSISQLQDSYTVNPVKNNKKQISLKVLKLGQCDLLESFFFKIYCITVSVRTTIPVKVANVICVCFSFN